MKPGSFIDQDDHTPHPRRSAVPEVRLRRHRIGLSGADAPRGVGPEQRGSVAASSTNSTCSELQTCTFSTSPKDPNKIKVDLCSSF